MTDFDAARQARRAKQRAEKYDSLREALRECDFSTHRQLTAKNQGKDDTYERRIDGHPGVAASNFVSEVLGEFQIVGGARISYRGMAREAGKGQYGITDGTITIDVQLTPIYGVSQSLEVPVRVKNGYMLRPGVFTNQGTPYVLAQSSLDDVLAGGSWNPNEYKPDRENMFSLPSEASPRSMFAAHRLCADGCGVNCPHDNDDSMGADGDLHVDADVEVDSGVGPPKVRNPMVNMTKREQEVLKRQLNTFDGSAEAAEQKAKERRKQRNMERQVPITVGASLRLSTDVEVRLNQYEPVTFDAGTEVRVTRASVASEDGSQLVQVRTAGVDFLVDPEHLF